MPERPDHVTLADPVAMRAYAHPLRLSLVSLLRREGPKTATQAAAQLGESVPSCSFHLRQLAKYGLVERVEGADQRERPWRATARLTSWDDAADDPAMRQAADQLTEVLLARYFQQAQQWLHRREGEPVPWRRVTGIGDRDVYLTVAEMAGLQQKIEDLIEAYDDRMTDPSRRPTGSRRVTIVQIAMTS
jgi:predicted ArsR family transcriptional regulator